MKKEKKLTLSKMQIVTAITLAVVLLAGSIVATIYIRSTKEVQDEEPVITLRVCNWEEYIDEGDWDPDEETIDLESGDILGVNPLYEDFAEWYYDHYGVQVEVEYSCFGTNEELYNMLTLGDEYDLVCPSDYMIMKLMSEDQLVPFSEEFFDEENPLNYYMRGVSPYIRNTFEENEINGEKWSKYAAGYMWGVTGILYNPDEVSREDASTWSIINNPDYARQITVKDNVRDTLFAAVGAIKADKLCTEEFLSDPNYHLNLMAEMNDTTPENVQLVQDYLQEVKNNVYSFESDSGKADMITGKVLANYQWSGDAVYAMDQAEEDDFYLEFAVPEECTNLWFDGWVMLKNGIQDDPARRQVAEAFINFLSRPDNAVRNMYYIGYSSVISGGEDPQVFEYLEWNYAADEESEETIEYPLGYFFSGDAQDEDYIIVADEEQSRRQLFAQYPSQEVIDRSAIMQYFDPEANARINQMWINIRCFPITEVPVWGWILAVFVVVGLVWVLIKSRKLS